MPLSRQAVIDHLVESLRPESFVLAIWLGGSDATGRTDELSDIDLCLLVEDEHVETAFERLDAVLESLSPTEARYRLPEPTWHGASQVFLRLRDTSPHHFLDICVLRRSDAARFAERERHGEPMVLHDPCGLIPVTELDWSSHGETLRKRLDTVRAMFTLFQPVFQRAVARGFSAEAAAEYHGLVLKPFVELLRMRHCPERFDFGLRYLDRDLPGDVLREVESWSFPRDAKEALEFSRRIGERVREEWAALDRGEWSLR